MMIPFNRSRAVEDDLEPEQRDGFLGVLNRTLALLECNAIVGNYWGRQLDF